MLCNSNNDLEFNRNILNYTYDLSDIYIRFNEKCDKDNYDPLELTKLNK